jgi:CRP/FNR family transcriptional regulator, cyclic AMP receptor protein
MEEMSHDKLLQDLVPSGSDGFGLDLENYLGNISKYGELVSYSEKEMIFEEGKSYDYFLVLLEGMVKECSYDGRKEFIVAVRGAGEVVGEVDMDLVPCRLTIRVIRSAKCIKIPTSVLRDIMAEDPRVLLGLIKMLNSRSRETTELAKHLALKSVYERTRNLLMGLIKETTYPSVIPVSMNYQAIGHRVGASRDMISKIFKDLQKGGYVAVDDDNIILLKQLPLRY